MALIELRNVSKVYKLGEVEVTALRDATADIEKGEYVALIGPSGSGKSTLMNTLGCLDRPTSGSYKLDGQEIVTMGAAERARIRNRQIGFVFQNFNRIIDIGGTGRPVGSPSGSIIRWSATASGDCTGTGDASQHFDG
jgi:ABC-type lipoprotein export system ATPase subunit